MEVNKVNFPVILLDNEELYFAISTAIIESVDELCCLQITKIKNGYNFRIAPSTPEYTNLLLQEILNLNNKFGIHLELGKSIKNNSTINYTVSLQDE